LILQKFLYENSFYSLDEYLKPLSNGATAQDGPRAPLRVSSILPGLGRLLSNFYILASLHIPPHFKHEKG